MTIGSRTSHGTCCTPPFVLFVVKCFLIPTDCYFKVMCDNWQNLLCFLSFIYFLVWYTDCLYYCGQGIQTWFSVLGCSLLWTGYKWLDSFALWY